MKNKYPLYTVFQIFLEVNELNIAFSFVILILENCSEKQAVSGYLEHFQGIENKK